MVTDEKPNYIGLFKAKSATKSRWLTVEVPLKDQGES